MRTPGPRTPLAFHSLGLGLMVLSVVTPFVPAASATPANGKIAFGSFRDGNLEIYVMDGDGSNQTRLTNDNGFDADPCWSPDGSKIAFRSNRDGENQIYVMNADGTNQTRLTNNGRSDVEPVFSPDGSKIVFASFHDNRYDLYAMNADGSGETPLTNNPDGASNRHPSFSPDGSKIVFGFTDDPLLTNVDIYVMNASGGAPTNLTSNDSSWNSYPSWSPDGAKIVFQRGIGDTDICVMDANGSNQSCITNTSATDSYPSWSPDGAKTTFARSPDGNFGNYEIYAMDADGSNPIQLTNTAGADLLPSWQPLIPDLDGDGISDDVDEEPLTPSTGFSDVQLGGQTIGHVVLPLPANTKIVIEDAPVPADGVKVRVLVAGSPAPPPNARAILQLVGKKSQIKLAIPGIYIVTDPDTESTVQVIENGPAEVVVTINGSEIVISIATGASATIVETTDSSGVLTDVSVIDVTGDPGGVTVNGTPVPPGGDPVLLAAFNARLRVQRGQFTLTGTFTHSGSTVINPGTQGVTLNVGPYAFDAGTLTQTTSGAYTFKGIIAMVELSLELKQAKGGHWAVKASGKPVSGFTNSVPVSLTIGNVVGSAQVTASLR